MGLLTEAYGLAKHARFVRKQAGVATKAIKPQRDGGAEIGLIEEFDHEFTKGQEIEVWRPSPFTMQLASKRQIKSALEIKFTSGELSPLAVQVFYRAKETLDETSSEFTPGSSQLLEGWLFCDCYADDDLILIKLDIYGRIMVSGPLKSQETGTVKLQWQFDALYSPLATGGL
jgi:hypothetical protein